MGISPEGALGKFSCWLINDTSLRGLIPEELAQGFGFSANAKALVALAVTPDELESFLERGKSSSSLAGQVQF